MMRRLRSHAKINWHLEVLGRRPDGYHELRTIFQTISLADAITLEPQGSGISLAIDRDPSLPGELPADESNLAWRAAELFLSAVPGSLAGVRIGLRKTIPLGGGLGGGSSNAAAVLAGLAGLTERASATRRVAPERLVELASELGADVPFFLHGGVAIGRGRGDRIEPLADARFEEEEVWLAVPPITVSTPTIFSALQALPYEPGGESGFAGEPWPGSLPVRLSTLAERNDLEAVCLGLHPELRRIYDSLTSSGARSVRMSGSGVTLVASFAEARDATAAGEGLPEGTAWVGARTLRRSTWRDSAGI